MRVSSRSSSNTLLIVVGAGSLALAILIFLTGGFRFDFGLFRLSLRQWSRPLIVSAIAWVALAVRHRQVSLTVLTSVLPFVDRHARAIALVIGTSVAASGIAFGTYAASGSDAGGYVGEAQLLGAGRIAFDEPLVRRVTWPDARHVFAPLGFRPVGTPGRFVPTYPPGLPLTMVPASAAFGELGSFLVSPLLGFVAVAATYAAASAMHSRIAGVVAAALMASSPIALYQVSQPMSDMPVTAWWALAWWLAWRPSRWRAALTGVAAGCAVLTRPNLLPLVAPIALTIVWTSAPARRLALAALAAFAVPIAASVMTLLAFQWRMYGSPFEPGYGSAAVGEFFAIANIGPNILDYAHRLFTGEWPSLLLFTAAAIIVFSRRPTNGWHELVRPLTLAFLFVVVVLVSYLPYGVFPDWSYLRFLLPAFPALFTAIGIVTAAAVNRVPRAVAGVALMAVTAVVYANVTIAAEQRAFAVRASEARYEFAGRYVANAFGRDTVVITAQHSASMHDYSGLPIVRWDLLTTGLDEAIDDLEALGCSPVIVVEEWERALMARRFPSATYARLDWRPRADIADEVRVYVYDPRDRHRAASYQTDRVH